MFFVATACLVNTELQNLPCIVPFIQCTVCVQPLIALQSNEFRTRGIRKHFGDFCFADTGFTFEKDRFFEVMCEIERCR